MIVIVEVNLTVTLVVIPIVIPIVRVMPSTDDSLGEAPNRYMPPPVACRQGSLLALPLLLPLLAMSSSAAPLGDKNANCAHWADNGECEANPTFMMSSCAASCSGTVRDRDGAEVCAPLVAKGTCNKPDVALNRCRGSCYRWLRRNLTDDTEGNCALCRCFRRAR